jgi:shikimate 5-dehydrogenase
VARNQVRAETRATDSVGTLIDTATAAGANMVEGLEFTLRERAAAQNDALQRAGQDARRQAEAAAAALGVESEPWHALRESEWDILVQATPLGREGEEVVPRSALAGSVIVDAAYGRGVTPLVAAGRDLGLSVFDGFDLLAAQAVGQFRLLTGRDASAAVFEDAARRFARSLA